MQYQRSKVTSKKRLFTSDTGCLPKGKNAYRTIYTTAEEAADGCRRGDVVYQCPDGCGGWHRKREKDTPLMPLNPCHPRVKKSYPSREAATAAARRGWVPYQCDRCGAWHCQKNKTTRILPPLQSWDERAVDLFEDFCFQQAQRIDQQLAAATARIRQANEATIDNGNLLRVEDFPNFTSGDDVLNLDVETRR